MKPHWKFTLRFDSLVKKSNTTISAANVSRLDYCNAALCGVVRDNVERLHHFQNSRCLSSAVHIPGDTITRYIITGYLSRRAWRTRRSWRTRSVTHNESVTYGIAYQRWTVIPFRSPRQLYICTGAKTRGSNLLAVPVTKSNTARRVFRSASPRIWNERLATGGF